MALTAAFAVTDGVNAWARYIIERESSVQDIVLSPRPTQSVDGAEAAVRSYPEFTLEDWIDAGAKIPNIAGVLLTVTGSGSARVPGQKRPIQLTLTTSNLPDLSALRLQVGRFFTQAEMNHRADVAVLDAHLAGELAAPFAARWVLGRSIWLNGRRTQVIGILSPLPGEHQDMAFAPFHRHAPFVGAGVHLPLPALRIKAASVEGRAPINSNPLGGRPKSSYVPRS